ncbi:hypothetical protein BBJ28_00024141, partial [Nothophytophthora sp. Chile5]
GPWKLIARHVGSRTPRQVMTHAQKYRMLIERRARGEAAGVSPTVPALTSTSEIANANETASSVAEPQPAEVLTMDSSMSVAEAETAATNGEMQVSSPSVLSQLGQAPHGDATDSFDTLGGDFLTTVMDDLWFEDMGTSMLDDDSEPL